MPKMEIYDPQRALVEDYRTFCVDNRNRKFILKTEEQDIVITGARLLLNLTICMPLIRRFVPISKNHLTLSGIYDAKVHADCLEEVCKTLEKYGYTHTMIGQEVVDTVQDVHNMCYTHLPTWIQSIDIFSIADTILQPGVKEVCQVDYGDISDRNVNRFQDLFALQSDKVYKLLKGDTLTTNVYRAPLLCGALKKGQFVQQVMSVGCRSDTDEHMFTKPIEGSFLSGMKNIQELAMESRSASKSVHYNITQMRATQYMNRQIHLQSSIIRTLHPGDCGSQVYETYMIEPEYVDRYSGKFYLDENNNLVELTKDRYKSVAGKVVKMREVTTCKYSDGACQVCAGTISKTIRFEGNMGLAANVNVGAPVAQQVLSSKHLTVTQAASYEIPGPLVNILYSDTHNVYLDYKLHKNIDVLAFGFQTADISKINDLKHFLSGQEIHASYFTSIKYMDVGIIQKDGTVTRPTKRTAMSKDKKTYPHLSPELLRIIREYPEDLFVNDGIYWISLRHIDPTRPVMQCTVVNDSIKKFVARFRTLVTSDVERYTSTTDFISDLKNLIWSKVDSHITHIATIAKACLITNRRDYSVPVVEDPNNVTFSSLSRNIPMRQIGGLLAFEGFNRAVKNPTTFIIPKEHGILDDFLGYQDVIERDREYPIKTGSPIEYDP